MVGQGVWSRKIKSALDHLPSLLSAKSISARECMQERGRLKKVSAEFDVVWICTRPEWQRDILEELKGFSGLAIIEKPYLNDKESLGRLFDFLELFPGKLQLSEPWTYTNIWDETKKLLVVSNSESIQIQRGGTTGHEYINGVLDWLPHDVNLLFDLFGDELLNAQFSGIRWSHQKREVQFKLDIAQSKVVSLRIGKFEEGRVALWKSGQIEVDFNKSYIRNNAAEMRIDESKNPFVTQLEKGPDVNLDRLKQQLRVHEVFRQKLFS